MKLLKFIPVFFNAFFGNTKMTLRNKKEDELCLNSKSINLIYFF